MTLGLPQPPDPATTAQALSQPLFLQPVSPAASATPSILPPAYDEKANRQAQAQKAAVAWLAVQEVLNTPGADTRKRGLYTLLCEAGDRSACLMAITLSRLSE